MYISTCMLISTHIYSVLQYIIYMFCKFIYIYIHIYICLLGFIDHNFSLDIGKNLHQVSSSKKNVFFACQIWVRSEAEVAIIGSTIAWGSQFGFRDSQVSRLKVDHAWGMRSFQNTKPNQDANNSKVVPLLSKMKKQIHLCILVIILGISARYVSLQFVIAILGGGEATQSCILKPWPFPAKCSKHLKAFDALNLVDTFLST